MKRRDFIVLLSSVTTGWPFAAIAQQTSKVPQVGFLYPGLSTSAIKRIGALQEGMRALGYSNTDNVKILAHASEGDPARLAPLAADLVERKVDVIVGVSPAAVRAAKSATAVIPILANDLESDPVSSGFVASLAHPGGNITGVFSDFPDFSMKWLDLLRKIIPALSSSVVLWDPVPGAHN